MKGQSCGRTPKERAIAALDYMGTLHPVIVYNYLLGVNRVREHQYTRAGHNQALTGAIVEERQERVERLIANEKDDLVVTALNNDRHTIDQNDQVAIGAYQALFFIFRQHIKPDKDDVEWIKNTEV